MLRVYLKKKNSVELPVTTCGYSMVKFARLDNVFAEFYELKASLVEVPSLQQKNKKTKKNP